MKKFISTLAVFAFIASSIFSVGAETVKTNEIQTQENTIFIEPFASDVLSGWIPSVSTSKFSANVTLISTYSGTAKLELQKKNSSGNWSSYDSASTSFSVKIFTISKSTTIEKGTYRLILTITVGGEDTVRTSTELTVS